MKIEYQKITLKIAAIYNILWGGWVVLFPQHFFDLVGMERINHPMVWQGMGMVIGVYGLGYWWSSHNPLRHWPIIMVGFLGKIFGPIGFIFNYVQGFVPFEFIFTLITNDFIWWIPFFLILKDVHVKTNWNLS
ncbi:alkyl hydroperoxide reductase [Marivirga harenae]|uniref:alkyl hydroperoxide reductase n=1 Tax=Marivirga harenae TaxID=2010992 RepID=UPI0026E08A37|nr:alkyl hydroperoxide reductase [Marivirga harenae]WKV11590.1 alkyl hydroperoxide reductase [Marivirga harenae]|tara:strand:+ start:81866 stop:82264 length:399 start_codon:yes stop_codon:yes gene_type:complete